MKKLCTLALMMLVLSGCTQPPDFEDTAGNGIRFADYEGQWLVINYWATWCAPCIKEIPELIALGENHDNITVMGVNFDQPEPEEAARQIRKMKITFPVIAGDPYLHFGVDKPQVLPTTLLIGPDGTVKEVLIGPQTEDTLLSEMGFEVDEPAADA